jgi:hypothetical protein
MAVDKDDDRVPVARSRRPVSVIPGRDEVASYDAQLRI